MANTPFRVRCVNKSTHTQTVMAYQQDMWLGLLSYDIAAWKVFSLQPGEEIELEIPKQFELCLESTPDLPKTSSTANLGENWVIEAGPTGKPELKRLNQRSPGPYLQLQNQCACPFRLTLKKSGRPLLACTIEAKRRFNIAPKNTLFFALSADYEQAELYEALTISETHHIDLKGNAVAIASIKDGPFGATLSHH